MNQVNVWMTVYYILRSKNLAFLIFYGARQETILISQLRGASLLIVMATIISIDLSREHKLSKNKTNIGKDYGNLKSCNRARINQT